MLSKHGEAWLSRSACLQSLVHRPSRQHVLTCVTGVYSNLLLFFMLKISGKSLKFMWINLSSLRPSLALSLWKRERGSVSCPVVFDPLWSHGLYVACQAPLSLGFSRQERWSGWPFPYSRGSSQPRNQQVSPSIFIGENASLKIAEIPGSAVPFLWDGGFPQSQVLFVWFCFAEMCRFSAQILS